jgi:hypothetical protein
MPAAVLGLLLAAPASAAADPAIPSDADLENSGAVIGEILIDNQNIFNVEDRADDRTAAYQDAHASHPPPAPVQDRRSLLTACAR